MNSITDTKPWFRQFWVWLVIAIPVVSVVSGLALVFIAVDRSDDLVADNYYREGKAINQVLDQDTRARELQMQAALTFNVASDEIRVSLAGRGELPDRLQLQLLHPVEADRDITVLLESVAPGSYRASFTRALRYRYYLRLLPETNRDWRLQGSIDFELSHDTVLPQGAMSPEPETVQ